MAEIVVPVVTVFDEHEKPDKEGNKHVIDFLIEHEVDGILVMGSNGEFPNLSLQDRIDYLTFYKEYVGDQTTLFAGTGCVSYSDTYTLTQAATDLGYKASLVIEPYYFAMGQEDIFRFYDRLATEVSGNLMIYNFPARSGVSIQADTVRRLVEKHLTIVGLKDSITEPGHTNSIFQVINPEIFGVYSGFDDQLLTNTANGGRGCIGALANMVPDIWSSLITAVNRHDFPTTIVMTKLIERLMGLYDLALNPAFLLKQLMVHRGVSIRATGLFPFDELDESVLHQAECLLDDVLRTYNALEQGNARLI